MNETNEPSKTIAAPLGNEKTGQTIFISAGEVSGDKHAGRLVGRLGEILPNTRFEGLGGPSMAENGCDLLENLVDRSAMLTHAVGQIGFYWKLKKRIKAHFKANKPDLVIVVDSPAWNFHVAKIAKRMGIPVLFYVAPQLWAWGRWRAGKLRRLASHVACILPFEEQWFRERNIPATYVGHPLFDDFSTVPAEASSDPKHFPTVALLPGSRKHEIEKLWLPMQIIARGIQMKYGNARFLTAASDTSYAELLRETADPVLGIEVRHTSLEAVTRHADLALIASGTATLEVAAQHCPMIVMYQVGLFQWYVLGKLLLKTKFISLVNILAQKELVPEIVPLGTRVLAVRDLAIGLLDDPEKLAKMREELAEMVKPVVRPGATDHVADIAKKLLVASKANSNG
ncbi:MAG: lipid-A-disaccharide synthase [Phycisphaerae bacterium]|nr:lipid-A-disaccharide synthase [Phycisphaerae bacterium]